MKTSFHKYECKRNTSIVHLRIKYSMDDLVCDIINSYALSYAKGK